MTFRHTSGFLVNWVFALFCGALLYTETRKRTPGGRRLSDLARTVACVAVGGAVLALVSAATAYLTAGRKHYPFREMVAFPVAALFGAGLVRW